MFDDYWHWGSNPLWCIEGSGFGRQCDLAKSTESQNAGFGLGKPLASFCSPAARVVAEALENPLHGLRRGSGTVNSRRVTGKRASRERKPSVSLPAIISTSFHPLIPLIVNSEPAMVYCPCPGSATSIRPGINNQLTATMLKGTNIDNLVLAMANCHSHVACCRVAYCCWLADITQSCIATSLAR